MAVGIRGRTRERRTALPDPAVGNAPIGIDRHATSPGAIGSTATRHGRDLLALGFTVSQVVHDYGDICQAVTELAIEQNAPITTDEFKTLNRCLDTAIAEAVTEHARITAESRSAKNPNDRDRSLTRLATCSIRRSLPIRR